jgi:hypothetical protein
MSQPLRCFLGHDFGPETPLRSTTHSVDDAGPGGEGRYTLYTTLLPARPGLTWAAGARAMGVDYAYLARRAQSARQEEVEFGLAVELLAIGAAFVYDHDRLAAVLQLSRCPRRQPE